MLVFGEIPGHRAGRTYRDRRELYDAGVHRKLQGGIAGPGGEGADSIVLSGGYEDDEDDGDEVIYTGEGGRDQNTGSQIADQQLIRGNLALHRSMTAGHPVRVIRGSRLESAYAPATGYRYDGLYRVESAWSETGKSGFLVWRYRLVREDRAKPPPVQPGKQPPKPERVASTVTRIVRDTALSKKVKELHDFECQVCGEALETPSGRYAEAAHIRPLGRPHDGPDVMENILCLCPNHHVLFDSGAFSIRDDLGLIGMAGTLRTARNHSVGPDYLGHQREMHGLSDAAIDEGDVLDMMKEFLFTSPGEQAHLPDYGAGLRQAIFEPNSPELAAEMQSTIRAGLHRWLGHVIEVRGVEVTMDPDTLSVEINYVLLRTGEVQITTFEVRE